jgi:transcription elongation factor SPT6
MADYIEREASLDPDEDEEEFDEETGEARPKANGKHFDDSSEEEDDDDDEEAARIRDGFIVDDEEEEDEEMADGTMVAVRRRKKRRRSHRDEEEDEVLDEEDLDLMLENTGEGTRSTKVSKDPSWPRLLALTRRAFRASLNA